MQYEKGDIGIHETKNKKIVMKKFFILLLSSMPYITMAQGIPEVHDSQSFIQSAMQFSKQWAEMIEQGERQAEQLMMEVDAHTERVQKIKDEVKRITDMTKDILILYREIDNCNTKLESIRKNLVKSMYLTTKEKYTIYTYAQNLCYDILVRKNTIEDIVADCKAYSASKTATDKKKELKDVTNMVRHIYSCLEKVEVMSIKLINYKKETIAMDYNLRQCFSVKLY